MASDSELRQVDPYGAIGEIEVRDHQKPFKPKFSEFGKSIECQGALARASGYGVSVRALREVLKPSSGLSPGLPE